MRSKNSAKVEPELVKRLKELETTENLKKSARLSAVLFLDRYSYQIELKYKTGFRTTLHIGSPEEFKAIELLFPEARRSCDYHLWKSYVGFREIYDYCEKCDSKREREKGKRYESK